MMGHRYDVLLKEDSKHLLKEGMEICLIQHCTENGDLLYLKM